MSAAFTFPPAFFVTGTDTNVGKTFVSALLVSGLQGHYWKPIQSGLEPCTDREWVKEKTGLPSEHFFPETYLFKEPVSPHLAAQLENIAIDFETIKLPKQKSWRHLIVEGAGGLMVPVNGSLFVVDLIKHLNLPALVVARSTLGTINHTLLTVEKLREKKIDVLGVIMNGVENPNNRLAIEKYGKVPVLAQISPMQAVNVTNLKQVFDTQFQYQ
jgi:dethiobiotin synthase